MATWPRPSECPWSPENKMIKGLRTRRVSCTRPTRGLRLIASCMLALRVLGFLGQSGTAKVRCDGESTRCGSSSLLTRTQVVRTGEHSLQQRTKPVKEQFGKRMPTNMDSSGMWNSQAGQDRLISMVLGGKQSGYFVDLAAAAPVIMSNTRALERDFDWSGLCIDGNDRLTARLRKARTCTVVRALISSEVTNVTYVKLSRGFSRIVEGESATSGEGSRVESTRTLESVLHESKAPKTMDYLSLDVEGHELAVLMHFPFHKYRWMALTIETVVPALRVILERHGYRHVLDITHPKPGGVQKILDRLYLHESIEGGFQAAATRALQSTQLWTSAMARRPFNSVGGSNDEDKFMVNCCGVTEAYVAKGGNLSALFPPRVPCACLV